MQKSLLRYAQQVFFAFGAAMVDMPDTNAGGWVKVTSVVAAMLVAGNTLAEIRIVFA